MFIKKDLRIFVLLFVILLLTFVVDIFSGNADISVKEGFAALFGGSGDEIIDEIIVNYRFPKAVTAIFAGSSLAIAGLLMQTLFRNPLAGPDVLGCFAYVT